MEGELRIIELYYKRRVLPVGFSCVGFSRLCGVPELPEALAPPIDLPTNYVCLKFQFIFIKTKHVSLGKKLVSLPSST